jgi:hypothetical protein
VAVTLSTACTIPDSACSPKNVTSMNAPFSNLLSRVSPNAHPRAIVETEICRMSENRTVQFWTLGFSPPRRVDENLPRNANGEGASTRLPRRQQEAAPNWMRDAEQHGGGPSRIVPVFCSPVWDVGVAGSNPATPTNKPNNSNIHRVFRPHGGRYRARRGDSRGRRELQ